MPIGLENRREQIGEFANKRRKEVNLFETPLFKRRSLESQKLIRTGIVHFGAVDPAVLKSTEAMDAVEDDFNTARHEYKHGIAIMPGATREGMSILPTSEYRGVTRYRIGSHLPPEQRAKIVLVASLASGVEDNLPYTYSHSGRGSDNHQAENAARFIALRTRTSVASVMAEGRSLASAYVSQLHEESVWRLYKNKIA